MTLFRVSADKLEPVLRTTYAAENLMERKDLQRLLRSDISPLGDDLLIIAEEFGDWEDCARRIDLLCLSKGADLAVVEIKRTEDGGHMELQAIRYAAMVSSMTLDQAIEAYSRTHKVDMEAARQTVLDFLEQQSVDDAELTGEVRIILVSSDFSTELTTAVLWLNKHELDITCIRLRPYKLGNEVLIDATQIIPLPESAEYEIKLRKQDREKRKVIGARQETLRKFWEQFIERSKARTQLFANRTAPNEQWLSGSMGRTGFALTPALTQGECRVECFINPPGGEAKSTAAFNELLAQKDEIEAAFGGPLEWQPLPGKQSCRICVTYPGGWGASETEWPELQDRIIDALIRLEVALKERVLALEL